MADEENNIEGNEVPSGQNRDFEQQELFKEKQDAYDAFHNNEIDEPELRRRLSNIERDESKYPQYNSDNRLENIDRSRSNREKEQIVRKRPDKYDQENSKNAEYGLPAPPRRFDENSAERNTDDESQKQRRDSERARKRPELVNASPRDVDLTNEQARKEAEKNQKKELNKKKYNPDGTAMGSLAGSFKEASDKFDPFKDHKKDKDPVDEAKLRAERKRDRSPAAISSSAKKKNDKKGNNKDNKKNDKNEKKTTKEERRESSKGAGSDASNERTIVIGKNAKRGILAGVGALSIIALIALTGPSSMISTGGDEGSITAAIGAGVQQDQDNFMQSAAAVQNARRCMSPSSAPASDSALNATGGTLFTPDGTQDPVEKVANFDPKQVMHAQEVVAVGKEMNITEKGIISGLLVAYAESVYWNLSNDGSGSNGALKPDQKPEEIAKSMKSPYNEGLPSDHGFGHRGDHGSVGIFQQQVPWWGNADELMNGRIAARKYFERLKTFDYNSMEDVFAGQKVQQSFDPTGNNYRKGRPQVMALYEKIKNTPPGFNKNYYQGASAETNIEQKSFNLPLVKSQEKTSIVAQGSQNQSGGGSLPDSPKIKSSEHLNYNSVRGARIVVNRWSQIDTIGGYRPGDPQDHGKGDAIDVMIPDYKGSGSKLGDDIAQFFIDNKDKLDVKYVIWKQRIYQPGAGDSWQPMENRGDDNQNHFNHVHVSFNPSDKYNGQEIKDVDGSGGGGTPNNQIEQPSNSDVSASDLTPDGTSSMGASSSAPSGCGSFTDASPAGATGEDRGSAMIGFKED